MMLYKSQWASMRIKTRAFWASLAEPRLPEKAWLERLFWYARALTPNGFTLTNSAC